MHQGGSWLYYVMAVMVTITAMSSVSPCRAESSTVQSITDRMVEERRRLITENLKLTPEEAKDFWPLYHELEDEMVALRKRRMEILGWLGENFDDNVSEEDALKMIRDQLAIEEMRINLYKRGMNQLKAVLPGRKLLLYFQIEGKISTYIDAGISDEIPLLDSGNKSDAPAPTP